MRLLNVLLVLLVFITLILLGFLVSEMSITGKVTYDRITANVTHVVDGDTLDVKIGKTIERLRLLGINNKEV